MKLVKMILGVNYNIEGFVVEGKAKEFGELGNHQVSKTVTFKHLCDIKFNNSQAYFSGGNITEKGGFHLSNLPVAILSGSELRDIDNSITLTSRYVKNNENIGFGVIVGGHEAKFKYADVIKLTELMKPTNFVIKTTEAGKLFIAGKAGHPLSNLPEIEIGEHSTAKKTKSVSKEAGPITGQTINDIDIMDLFDFVNYYNGFIINFADTKYEATGEYIEPAASQFKPLGIGEIASPRLDFNEDKFNASCKFRNPGVVTIGETSSAPAFAGVTNNKVFTYVFRTKNIFRNGQHYLTRIGVILPDSAVESFIDKFSSSMAITPITDPNVISVVNQLINWPNSCIFEVDTSKLSLMSPKKYDRYIMDAKDIYRETMKLAKAKISLKYARGAINELGNLGYVTAPKGRKIAAQFSMKSEEELKALILAGVDVYTGAFIDEGQKYKNNAAPGDPVPEVRYIINGLDPKNYDYKKLTSGKCPDFIAVLMDRVNAQEDLIEKSKLLQNMVAELSKVEADAKRTIWMHKAAMWLKNNKLGVHKNDKDLWVLNTKKRTKATCYDCTLKSAEGLQLLVTNTDIC